MFAKCRICQNQLLAKIQRIRNGHIMKLHRMGLEYEMNQKVRYILLQFFLTISVNICRKNCESLKCETFKQSISEISKKNVWLQGKKR